MWARLDDELIDHRKIFAAGERLGKNGAAIALGFWTVGLLWANKHLTDGHLPKAVVKSFAHVSQPAVVADALVSAGLWEKRNGGYDIHDYKDFNPAALVVKARRRKDKFRKRRERRS